MDEESMKFKVFTHEKEATKKALEEFGTEYLNEFKKKGSRRIMGIKVSIKAIPPLITEDDEGVTINFQMPFPKQAMILINKKQWTDFIRDFLKARKINFRDIKYIGE
jgi:hypothetical protein